MILHCSKCKQPMDISGCTEAAVLCPACKEELDISRLRESTCPICCSEFGETDTLVMCPDCKTLYHAECWEENHGCSTYGCKSTQHLETHNTAGGGKDIGTVDCPFCGGSHAASDLICPSCGHVLQDDAGGNDDMLKSIRSGVSDVLPKLARNFKLLFADFKSVSGLARLAFIHYADFKGRSSRGEYLAFVMLCFGVVELFFLLQAAWPAWIVIAVCLVPAIAVTVRRLRDTGLSPWMIFAIPLLPLLVLVPTVDE